MATKSEKWLNGIVKAVPSGDSLVIIGIPKGDAIPPEKNITLSSIIAPKLAYRGGIDEPFAWKSREFLRKLCLGKKVNFRVDYSLPSNQREFATVWLESEKVNVSHSVVSQGWAEVKKQRNQKGESSSDVNDELLRLEEKAKDQGLGKWSKITGAGKASIRDLPPSAVGSDPGNFDAMAFVQDNKGKSFPAIVEQVRDGSTVRVYFLSDFNFVQVFVAGIQSPSMGKRAAAGTKVEPSTNSNQTNGKLNQPNGNHRPNSAQKVAVSATTGIEVAPDPFGKEAKHFTEMRVLHRDVRVIPEGFDKFSNLIGTIYYNDGNEAKNLAVELVKNGLAKYVEWTGKCLEEKDRRELKTAEVEAKKQKIRMWTNFVPPRSNSKSIQDKSFIGMVVEVISGDCIVVADDAVPFGNPLSERRVNLSSIRAPLLRSRDEKNNIKSENYAREAKEFLRQKLIGRKVNVSMEYSRKVGSANGSADSRVMDFGSVFLGEGDNVGGNIAEMLVIRGLARVVRHRDFEERSNYYDALLIAEAEATANKKGMHSPKDYTVQHILDLTTASAKKAKDHLPHFPKGRVVAIVEYVLSGHRFKLLIPNQTCSIAFSFSGVRCPGRGGPYADEALSFMRRKILQREVEIEVETVDKTGTFLGSLWESKTNMAVVLLENGYAKLQTFVGVNRITDTHLLAKAEASAKCQKLKVWENYVEGQEVVANETPSPKSKQKETLKVVVTEVVDGSKFYVQSVEDQMVASVQQQLASLDIGDAPIPKDFNPKKGDLVLAQFSVDNSWNRATIVSVPCGGGSKQSPKDEFEVFYVDYGNQEVVPYCRLRPLPPSIQSIPGLAQLCTLAFIKVPSFGEEYWKEAAEYLCDLTVNSSRKFRATIEDKVTSNKGTGTGTVLLVTLDDDDEEDGSSVNAEMLEAGLARLEKRNRRDSRERRSALNYLEKFQNEARKYRSGMWQYGDVLSDDEVAPPVRRDAGTLQEIIDLATLKKRVTE